jgi:hypothetical protein
MVMGSEHFSRRWLAAPLALAAGLALAMPVAAAPVASSTVAHDMPAPSGQCEDSVESAMLMPFSEHMNHAHFERSPQQQASDIQSTGQYVNTHAVLVQSMAKPGEDALGAVPEDSLTPFVEHMKYAHIQRPAQQQVSDAQQTDDYVKLHTVLPEHMTQPARTALIGGC